MRAKQARRCESRVIPLLHLLVVEHKTPFRRRSKGRGRDGSCNNGCFLGCFLMGGSISSVGLPRSFGG